VGRGLGVGLDAKRMSHTPTRPPAKGEGWSGTTSYTVRPGKVPKVKAKIVLQGRLTKMS